MASEALINAVIGLCEAFGRTASEATIGAYDIGLRGLSDAEIERAAALALRTCKFMPVPAELRELATGQGEGFEAMAEKAFHALKQAMQRLGPDYSVNFADGLINATVRLLGGWIRVNEIPVGDELDKWFRKEFIATYVRQCKSGASEELRRYLGGNLERDNAHLDGRPLPNGGTYRLGMYGSEVHAIGVDYKPALPAPEPKRQLAQSSGEYGLELKQLSDLTT
jgi:hypothetical protein